MANKKSIYELLLKDNQELDREHIDKVNYILTKLSPLEKGYIFLAYGEDLNNPVRSEIWNKQYSSEFYSYLVPKLKRMMERPWSDNYGILEEKLERKKSRDKINVKLLLSLKNDSLDKYNNVFNDEELNIINLISGRLGEYYSIGEIAMIINKPKKEVLESIRKITKKLEIKEQKKRK